MITKERVLEIMKEAGAMQEGHFLLTSGLHSAKYLQCAKVFQNCEYSEELCRALAEKFEDKNIEVVIGPALGAVQMAYEVSRHLKVPNYFAERVEGVFELRRGFVISPKMRVLVVEDVTTTGGSVREVIELVQKLGGEVAGVGAIVDRTGGKIDFGVPFESVLPMEVTAYEKDSCPLCKEGLELFKPGSRNIKK